MMMDEKIHQSLAAWGTNVKKLISPMSENTPPAAQRPISVIDDRPTETLVKSWRVSAGGFVSSKRIAHQEDHTVWSAPGSNPFI